MPRTREWTDADKAHAADLVTSYVNGLSRALAHFDVEQDELDDVLLDLSIEVCPGCSWYDDCHALLPVGESEPDGQCSNCR